MSETTDQDVTIKEANRLYQRGRFYLESGLTPDAVEVLTQVTGMVPDSPRAWAALAEAQRRSGDDATADASEARADEAQARLDAKQQPAAGTENPNAAKGRVFEVRGPGEVVERLPGAAAGDAEAADGTVAAVIPQNIKEHVEAYKVCSADGDWPGAERAARAIVDAYPDDAKAWGSLGLALRYQFQLDAGVEAHKRAAELAPDEPGFLGALAKSTWEAGDFERAGMLYARLLEEMADEDGAAPGDDPVYADTRLAAGMLTMLQGNLESGLDEYEWRWKTGKIGLPPIDQPMWDGAPAPGQKILYYGEQGFGDAIQFARFIPRIADNCAKVIVPSKPAVKRLLGSVAGNPDVTDETVRKDSFDQYIPAMSSMRVFGMRMDTIPADVPYLKADPEDVRKFETVIGDALAAAGKPADKTLKIGIAWTGSPTNTISWKKTIDPALFKPLLAAADTAFFSLQVLRDEMPDAVTQVPVGVTDLAPHLTDFADTAAAIECLDLVITVDTAVAHLAGALAKPVWNMLPFVPDWRWFLDREDSPWYPTMRLFRQKSAGDWRAVLVDVAAALRSYERPKKSLLGRLFGGDD